MNVCDNYDDERERKKERTKEREEEREKGDGGGGGRGISRDVDTLYAESADFVLSFTRGDPYGVQRENVWFYWDTYLEVYMYAS